jgi:molybdopterin synthase catalytic subunit
MTEMETPPSRDWIAVTAEPLALDVLLTWATRPECGAVVTFSGVVRDTSEDRAGIEALEYETQAEVAEARIAEVVAVARSRWPDLVAIAVHHRVGRVELGEPAVLVAVSSPHRGEAFAGAQFCIDELKATVPLWKRDVWAEGSAWSRDVHELRDVTKG